MAKRPDEMKQPPEPLPEKSGRGWPKWSIWLLMGLIGAFIIYPAFNSSDDSTSIPYDQFLSKVIAEEIIEININNQTGKIQAESVNGDEYSTTGPLELSPTDRQILDASSATVEFKTPQPGFFQTWLPLLLPVSLIILFFWWINRRAQGQMSGMMSIGRSRAKSYSSEQPGTTFEDVAGYEGVKQEIREVVDFLKEPEKFSEIGARVPKGVLLVGPPGTGKTLIARAVAGEAGVPFFSISGSEFVEMFVGVGASRVRDLFEQAKKNAPCIVFIDEIDAVGRQRGAGMGGGNDEREQTLNQLLTEMDGFEGNSGIIIVAATNRPDVLDSALMRPGRFDRQVTVDRPDYAGRLQILNVHAKDKTLSNRVDDKVVALQNKPLCFYTALVKFCIEYPNQPLPPHKDVPHELMILANKSFGRLIELGHTKRKRPDFNANLDKTLSEIRAALDEVFAGFTEEKEIQENRKDFDRKMIQKSDDLAVGPRRITSVLCRIRRLRVRRTSRASRTRKVRRML